MKQFLSKEIFTLLLLLLATATEAAYGLRILGLFPHPGISHFHFFHPIMRGLAEAGHEVTVVSHFPDKSPPSHYKDLVLTGKDTLTNTVDLKFFDDRRIYTHFEEFFLLHEWGKDACNHTLRSPALAQAMKQRPGYDVIIMEQFNSDCMMGVAWYLQVPVIALSSCPLMPWHYERVGAPYFPSYIPALFVGQSENMDFMGRLGNWISFHGLRLMYSFFTEPATNAIVRHKFGHNTPSVGELIKNTSLFFVNQHYSLSGAKPLPPSVIELGGIHIQKAKPLDPEIQRFLDNADDGVVYISWGSMIRAETLPAEKREGIVRAIRRLKQKVIWKWENDTLVNQPSNLFISKWLPQRDILCHPNVKVFMTHAGLMGSSEAAYCGVPVVATPMYGDQFLNAAAMVHRGMGTLLNFEDISENTVIKAIRAALEKKSMENAKAVSYSFKNRPKKALETAIWWVEHVARTRGAPLTKSSSVEMSPFILHSLDVYLLFGTVIVTSAVSWIYIIKKLCFGWKKSDEKIKRN